MGSPTPSISPPSLRSPAIGLSAATQRDDLSETEKGDKVNKIAILLHFLAVAVIVVGLYLGIQGGIGEREWLQIIGFGSAGLVILVESLYFYCCREKNIQRSISHLRQLEAQRSSESSSSSSTQPGGKECDEERPVMYPEGLPPLNPHVPSPADNVCFYSDVLTIAPFKKGVVPSKKTPGKIVMFGGPAGHLEIRGTLYCSRGFGSGKMMGPFLLTENWPEGQPLPGYFGETQLVCVQYQGKNESYRFWEKLRYTDGSFF